MSGNRACLYFCQAFSMGRWVNPLRSSAGFRFCCCYSYPQCTTSFKLTSLVSLCLCGELLCKSVFRNVCSTLSFKSSFALCQRGSLCILLPPSWQLMLLLVTPHWFTWWWAEGGGSVLCYEYALISARPCVSLSNHSCGSGLRISSFASHPTPGIEGFFFLFFPSISFIGFHQCPKGTRFFCPSPRTFRRWGEGPGWGFVLFLWWPLFPSFRPALRGSSLRILTLPFPIFIWAPVHWWKQSCI